MECNKEEAMRAKEIAEKKLSDKDYKGARKFTEKASKLYASLGGLQQLIDIIHIYIASEKKLSNGMMDWYGILQVTSSLDINSIKKRYKMLALSLHPDKNKYPHAEGAFKMLGQAWTVISDPSKRCAYDLSVLEPKKNQTCAQNRHLFNRTRHNFMTFWTICPCCKMMYEYSMEHLHCSLLCRTCLRPFVVNDIPNSPGYNGRYFPRAWHVNSFGEIAGFGNFQAFCPVYSRAGNDGFNAQDFMVASKFTENSEKSCKEEDADENLHANEPYSCGVNGCSEGDINKFQAEAADNNQKREVYEEKVLQFGLLKRKKIEVLKFYQRKGKAR